MRNDALAELLGDFLLEAEERLARVESLMLGLEGMAATELEGALAEARRQLHTLKGNSGMMGFTGLQDRAHRLEDAVDALDPEAPAIDPILEGLDRFRARMAELREGAGGAAEETREAAAAGAAPEPAAGEQSVRVPLQRLERLADLAAELVVARHHLERAIGAGAALAPDSPELAARSADLWLAAEESRRGQEKILDALQDGILRLRMVPMGALVGRLRRLVRDEARAAGRRVRLETRGEETPLDRTLVELAGEALGHLVRNAVIHGIEPEEVRHRRGKPATGTVLVQASVRSGSVQIEVVDDGGGIDRPALVEAARRAGIDGAEGESLHALIFHPRLSTREEADLSAGRGVGLSAALDAVHRHGGAIDVATVEGTGTRFCLRLPLSVAIALALRVEVDGEEYALPAGAVVETLALDAGAGARSSRPWRGSELPLLDLGVHFGTAARPRERGFVVVVEVEGVARGLIVDRLGELGEIVVKALDPVAGRPAGIAGSTILGDGRVVMILDAHGLTLAERVGESA